MCSVNKCMLVLLGLFMLYGCSKESVHEKVLTVDTHVDTPYMLTRSDWNIGEPHTPDINRVDFPRMKEGGLDAIFFAVFIGQGPRTPEGNQDAKEQALNLFDLIKKAVKNNPEQAELAYTPDDAYEIEKKGKRAVYIGIENGYPIGKDILQIEKFYHMGARYITLCHTRNNDICDSSTDTPEHHGLSEFGEKVVHEMNRLGIMIDVSHISDKSFYDVISFSKAPVIASHSCARAICNSSRNLNDDMLKKLAENNGVIQICMVPSYVKEIKPDPAREEALTKLREKYDRFSELSEEEREKAHSEWDAVNKKYPPSLPSISDFVDHIDHIVKVVGIEHVGIGSDFDGGRQMMTRDADQLGTMAETDLESEGKKS
ncbi:MAG: membrane dipeptidase [bacterium]